MEDHVPTAPAPPPTEWDADWDDGEGVVYADSPDSAEDAEWSDVDDVAGFEKGAVRDDPEPDDATESDGAEPDRNESDGESAGHAARGGGLARLKDAGAGARERAVQLWSSTAERVRERNAGGEEPIVIGESVSLDARRSERRREMRKIRLKRVGIGAGIIAVVLLISWVLFGSPFLRYEYDAAQISGYSEPSIVDKAELEQLVASHDGQALLSLNERALENDIEAAIPEIAGVSVTREFPRSMSIVITEAVPVACLGTGDDCTAVTEEGEQLDIPPEIAIALPRIGAIGSDLDRGQAVDDALAVLGALSSDTRGLVSEIAVANGDLVTIHLVDGRTVFWGGLDRNDFKAQVLDALVAHPASHYDVSIPDAPVSR